MRVEVPHNRQLAANLWHSGKTKLRCLHCNSIYDLYIMHKKGLSTTKPFMRMVTSILPLQVVFVHIFYSGKLGNLNQW